VTAACLPSVCASAVVPCIDLGGQSLAAHRGDRGSIPDKSFGAYGGQSGSGTGFPLRMFFSVSRSFYECSIHINLTVNYGVINTSKSKRTFVSRT